MKLLVTLLLSFVAFSSNALEINIVSESDTQAIVKIKGNYDRLSYVMIANLVNQYSDRNLVIRAASPGGYANNLPKIMDKIHSHGNVTWIADGFCASACAWSGIAAKEIRGKLWFHGVFQSATGQLNPIEINELQTRIENYGIKSGDWYSTDLVATEFK